VHLLRYVVKCTVIDFVEHSNKLFELSSICLDTFLTRVTRELVALRSTAALLMLLAALRR